jgi:hypothetical protein
VSEPTTISPGDQVHALLGGIFVVRTDGSVETSRLRLPKPILEKSYGTHTSDADLLGMMAKVGRGREIEKPAKSIDYNAARKAAAADGHHPKRKLMAELAAFRSHPGGLSGDGHGRSRQCGRCHRLGRAYASRAVAQ